VISTQLVQGEKLAKIVFMYDPLPYKMDLFNEERKPIE
jgi:hypothetical protein